MKVPSFFTSIYFLISVYVATALPGARNVRSPKGFSRKLCQSRTRNPLDGCPKGTILVSQTSKNAKFATIQSAITSLPNDTSEHIILIQAGNYTEQLNVTRSGPITLLGETEHVTSATSNLVTVIWAAGNNNTGVYSDNVFTSVLTVAPTLNASLTGSGPTGFPVPADTPFGNTDFKVYNIDFRNTYMEYSAGPAHAISFSYANGGFYYSGFYSYQDTVYVGKLGNAYFYKNIIAGQTDFLYGFGTAWLQSCDIQMRSCGGGITAWKGTNTTFVNKYGIYIADSKVYAANSTIAPQMVGKCALGRPWNSQHRSIFANTYEDASIRDSGYIDWVVSGVSRTTNLTFMAEYHTYGPGFNLTGRILGNETKVLTPPQYIPYNSPAKVFQTMDGKFANIKWIDFSPWD